MTRNSLGYPSVLLTLSISNISKCSSVRPFLRGVRIYRPALKSLSPGALDGNECSSAQTPSSRVDNGKDWTGHEKDHSRTALAQCCLCFKKWKSNAQSNARFALLVTDFSN